MSALLTLFDDALSYSPPAATRYVSSSATNGYASGSDSGSGNSRAAPWATIDYAIANSVDGDVIWVNAGTYTATTFFTISKTLTFVSDGRRMVTMRAATGQPRLFNYTASTDKTLKCYGLVMDGASNIPLVVRVGSSALTSTLSLEFNDCEMKDFTTQYINTNSHKNVNLRLVNCAMSGTMSTNLGITVPAHESGSIIIDGLDLTVTMSSTSTKEFIKIVSATGATNTSIRRINGSITASSASGGLTGVRCINHDDVCIENNTLSVTSVQAGAVFSVLCDSGSLSANNAVIQNNVVTASLGGGYGIIVGQDGPSAGDNRQNNATIYNNRVTANPLAALPIHGLMIGYGQGGYVADNTVNGAALATIAKQQTGGEFRNNTILNAASEAIRAKGASGTKWIGNTITIGATYPGDGCNINANDAPVTDSTNIEITGNTFIVDAAPSEIVEVTTGSDASFSTNTYTINTTLGAGAWKYQGTPYDTLAEWKVGVEPTALP